MACSAVSGTLSATGVLPDVVCMDSSGIPLDCLIGLASMAVHYVWTAQHDVPVDSLVGAPAVPVVEDAPPAEPAAPPADRIRSERRCGEILEWVQRNGGAIPKPNGATPEERSLAASLVVVMAKHRQQELTIDQLEQLRQNPIIAGRLRKAEERRPQAALGGRKWRGGLTQLVDSVAACAQVLVAWSAFLDALLQTSYVLMSL